MPVPPVIVEVGDTHCGSVTGLCPPDFATADGSSYEFNPLQSWIWECWTHFNKVWLPAILRKRPYILVLKGDLTEGIHHHNGREVIHADPAVHAKAALTALLPLASRAAKVYVVRGTDCHVGSAEAALGERLGATPDPVTKEHSSFHWRLNVHRTLCSFQHHMGTTSRLSLEGTQLTIQLAEEQAQAARAGHPIPRVVSRAHRHIFGTYTDSLGLFVAGASWQLKTVHAHKVVPSSRSMIGAHVLDFDAVPPGHLPTVRPCIYTLNPPPPDETSPLQSGR